MGVPPNFLGANTQAGLGSAITLSPTKRYLLIDWADVDQAINSESGTPDNLEDWIAAINYALVDKSLADTNPQTGGKITPGPRFEVQVNGKAMFRRIRRYTTSQRRDMIDGTDMIYDDNNGWYTHININKYKLIGQKDVLVARHTDDALKKLTRVVGQGFWNGIPRERTKCWVVEAVNRDPDYIYSKRVWYLDPENWQMNVQEMYDRQGKLWKVMEQFYNEYKLVEAEGMASHVNSEHTVDLIRRHGSVGQYEIYKIGTTLDDKIFSVANLQQLSY